MDKGQARSLPLLLEREITAEIVELATGGTARWARGSGAQAAKRVAVTNGSLQPLRLCCTSQ